MSALQQIQHRPEPQQTDVRTDLARTAQANAAAHDADLRDAVDSVAWTRTGLLGRLRRADH